jgi:hypothetical protein
MFAGRFNSCDILTDEVWLQVGWQVAGHTAAENGPDKPSGPEMSIDHMQVTRPAFLKTVRQLIPGDDVKRAFQQQPWAPTPTLNSGSRNGRF